MDRYLTLKGIGRSWWELPVAIYGAVMTTIGVVSCAETAFEPGEVLVTLFACALLLGFVSFPLWLILLRWKRRRLAQKIAEGVSKQSGEAIPLEALDRRLGVSDAEQRIRKLIGLGYLEHLDIDQRNRCVWFAPERKAADASADNVETDDVLTRIRALNDAIDHEAVSRQITRIEAATQGVLQVVARYPERSDDVRRLMNYYLPTTIKLLQTYDMMEDQQYQGENIRISRQRIEDILEKLADAIERQQDRLFSADALDVEAEISVMETMLKANGAGAPM